MTLELERLNLESPHPMRVTLEDFDKMIKAGVFDEKPRIELLDGEIIEMAALNPPHTWRVKRIYDRLLRQFDGRCSVFSQSPIELPHDGRPQPDISLVRLGLDETVFAQPEDVHLVIEVSDSTLRYDRTKKLQNYARDGIQEYWIVNLNDHQLEVYRDPQHERYATSFTVQSGSSLPCVAFPDDLIDWS